MIERPPHTEAELVELLRSIDVRAPGELHDRIQTLVDESSSRRPRRTPRVRASSSQPRPGWRRLGGGGSGRGGSPARHRPDRGHLRALDLQRASATTLRPARMAAPARARSGGRSLLRPSKVLHSHTGKTASAGEPRAPARIASVDGR